MLYANDKTGKRTHINNTLKEEEYFCPICGEKLLLRKGSINKHHFAHSQQSICQDSWHYDMTPWHYEWQNKFPKDTQEVVKSLNNFKHRADVLLEKEKTVLEFQHSPISIDEFENRNNFYNKLGYKVIWIFNESSQFENGNIENYRDNLWKWLNPRRTFEHFDSTNKNVTIYLEFNKNHIVRITWCPSDRGLARFATDGKIYSDLSLIKMFTKNNTEPPVKLSALYDTLIKLNIKDHTTYFLGCPISSTHVSASCRIDVPKCKYSDIMPCECCDFAPPHIDYQNPICNKRFIDLHLDNDTIVQVESRDKYNFVNKLSYFDGQEKQYIELETFEQNISKSIFELWQDNYAIAIFRNITTGKRFKINQNPKEQYSKYGKVYGYFVSDTTYGKYASESCQIFAAANPEWVCDWYKIKQKIPN